MRAAGERVKAAIKGLLAAALQEPRTSALLEAMAGRVAAFAQDLVDKQQWGHARVCCRFHKHLRDPQEQILLNPHASGSIAKQSALPSQLQSTEVWIKELPDGRFSGPPGLGDAA
jgi:hypothetical protein